MIYFMVTVRILVVTLVVSSTQQRSVNILVCIILCILWLQRYERIQYNLSKH